MYWRWGCRCGYCQGSRTGFRRIWASRGLALWCWGGSMSGVSAGTSEAWSSGSLSGLRERLRCFCSRTPCGWSRRGSRNSILLLSWNLRFPFQLWLFRSWVKKQRYFERVISWEKFTMSRKALDSLARRLLKTGKALNLKLYYWIMEFLLNSHMERTVVRPSCRLSRNWEGEGSVLRWLSCNSVVW